jgi:hypothetical protein
MNAMRTIRRLWLAVVLQAIAEQRAEFVITEQRRDRGRREAERVAAEAKNWVQSKAFWNCCCDFAGVSAFARCLRDGSPALARKALLQLMRG